MDGQGHNLVFGKHRIYSFHDIDLRTDGADRLYMMEEVVDGDTLFYFELKDNISKYYLQLDESTTHELYFDLTVHEDKKCCSTFYSRKGVRVDGADLGDPDVIVITE